MKDENSYYSIKESIHDRVQDQVIFNEANEILKDLYGTNAEFREGQYEAIEATILHNRTLVVQKTGWGKSLVYFICTRLLRDRGRGVTMVVSPLLALMDNQLSAATSMGLKSDILNSRVKDRRVEIIEELKEYKENEGYIFTNIYADRSLIIIGPTTSAEDFQDTFDHEKGHLAMHIAIARDIDPFSEEFQYLNGVIGKQMFRAGKMFLCEHCRTKLLERE